MAQCSVTVTTSISGLAVSPTSKTLNVGEKLDLSNSVTKTPSTAREGITWTSSNSSIASVSQTGVITANSAGTATITVKSSSGNRSATCIIKVQNEIIIGRGDATYHAYLEKWDTNGNQLWAKDLGPSSVNVISQTTDGGYLIGRGDATYHAYLEKWDTNGNQLWTKDLGPSSVNAISK